MKFTTKITQLTIASAVSSILVSSLLSAIATPKADVVATQIAQILAPEEVNLRGKQIIVRIDGANIGSGSILEHNGDRYKVLTNWHVMQNEGGYTVQTIDGRKHQVIPESIKRLGGLDLAVFEFTSNQNYQTAELGDSGSLNEGQIVYFGGYPGELRREDNRYYRFFTANLVGILPRSTENGYSLIYNGEAFPGMSGGPVFNAEGLLIGVHGEANVAFTGGTSNYAIPIASYQQIIAQQAAPQENSTPNTAQATPPAAETPASQPEAVEEVPEVIVEQPASQPEPTSQPEAVESADNTPAQSNDSNTETTEALNSENISSVPTFSSAEQPESKSESEDQQIEDSDSTAEATESPSEDKPEAKSEPEVEEVETEQAEQAEQTEESTPQQEVAVQPEAKPETESVEVESEEIEIPTVTRKIALVSPKTGIDYTKLRNLLKEGKWSEADLHTYQLVGQIVESAKLNNKRTFIELKTIAEYSCPDVRTIDYLWKKYSNDRFGFSPQQQVWKSVNQKGDFSTETWRRFATEVGWKEGEVDSGSGYLLYEQLDFEPDKAPAGHLPWWFAMADEEQKVIKSLFSRCNLNPTLAELEAETQNNSADTAQNSDNNGNTRDTNDVDSESNADKQSTNN